jgi:hypothetical protein
MVASTPPNSRHQRSKHVASGASNATKYKIPLHNTIVVAVNPSLLFLMILSIVAFFGY